MGTCFPSKLETTAIAYHRGTDDHVLPIIVNIQLSFKFDTNKMRTSHLYVLLLSALVVQISSETSDQEKILGSILSSSFEIAAKPIADLINAVPMNLDADKFLKEFTWKLKRLMEQTQDELFNMIPKTERENTKKAIGYLSMYMSGASSDALRLVARLSNKSVDALPDNIKTKFLDIENDIDDFLKKIRVDLNGPKTSQKTS
ncbi:uncharacterized protein LOC132941349 [Metopolophium dirhodum]|uniref:uncharacterized protein LOC132941349 n=1 Tax=Metopolophium dirhodum TaxID=44670 RepID=UPI00298FC6F7|nr:uncharacterized protein LOC132941349 [Metopolophium dirhodum]